MATLESVLDSLDPPIGHELLMQENHASLLLIDKVTGVMVQRDLTLCECKNQQQFGLVLLYAINELRLKGLHTPIPELPVWDWEG